MRRSKVEIYLVEIYLHFVWGTWGRMPLVAPEIERDVYRSIEAEAHRLKCRVLAIGGMPDHVHLLVRVSSSVSAALLMQQVKGVSSTIVRDKVIPGELFRWQEGYGVFSVSRPHVRRVIAYINNQQRHHIENTLWPEWEQSEEKDEPAQKSPVREDG